MWWLLPGQGGMFKQKHPKRWGKKSEEEKRALVFLQMRISKRVSTWSNMPGKLFTKIPTIGIQWSIKILIFGSMQVSQKKHSESSLITAATQTLWMQCGPSRECHDFFFADRDIHKGEELTFNYGWTLPAADLKWGLATKCKCGEISCIGTIEMEEKSN